MLEMMMSHFIYGHIRDYVILLLWACQRWCHLFYGRVRDDVTLLLWAYQRWCHLFYGVSEVMMSVLFYGNVRHDVTCLWACQRQWCHLFLGVSEMMMSLVYGHVRDDDVTCLWACLRWWCHLFMGVSEMMMSLLFYGRVRDALSEWCETQQENVSLVFFGFAKFIISAVKPVQNSQNTVTLIKPGHGELLGLMNFILMLAQFHVYVLLNIIQNAPPQI